MEGIQHTEALRLSEADLDQVLMIQLVVAWAGEGRTVPPRMGWWRTGLNDDLGGRDLFRRLTPHTWAWVTLEAARLAARKVDAALRGEAADADLLQSLFRLGFQTDEQLDDRLATHKRHGVPPPAVLTLPFDLDAAFDRSAFASWLGSLAKPPAFETTAVGRRLRGVPPDVMLATVRSLAAALSPLAEPYPAPHYRLGR